MHNCSFEESVQQICGADARYDPDAYFFLREALDFVTKQSNETSGSRNRHVSGKELLSGFRDYTLQEFGPMALTVLLTWGVNTSEDVGNLVFNLVEAGKLGKTEHDKREDFANGFDFKETFAKPFEPIEASKAPARKSGRRKK